MENEHRNFFYKGVKVVLDYIGHGILNLFNVLYRVKIYISFFIEKWCSLYDEKIAFRY